MSAGYLDTVGDRVLTCWPHQGNSSHYVSVLFATHFHCVQVAKTSVIAGAHTQVCGAPGVPKLWVTTPTGGRGTGP